MDVITELFNNSIMQSMIIGPIMGVIFGVIFTGLTKRPPSHAPLTIVQTREVYVTRVIDRGGRRSNSEEGGGILFVAGIGLLFVLWKYAIYVNDIHHYIGLSLLTALSSSIASILLSYIRGQFTSEEWWFYLISPLVILSGCLYLLDLAHATFDPKLTEAALQNNLWHFYTKSLNEYGQIFMLTHVSGVVMLCLVILFSFLALMHYLALMNQRSSGTMSNFWFFLARITMFFSGRSWLVASGILFVMAYIGIEPQAAATWLTD